MAGFDEWMAGIDAAIPTVTNAIMDSAKAYDTLFNPDEGNPSVPAPAPAPAPVPTASPEAPKPMSMGLVVAVLVLVMAALVLGR